VRAKSLQTERVRYRLPWLAQKFTPQDRPSGPAGATNAKPAGPDPIIRGSANGPRASGIVAQQPSDLAL
jgi:hypothetical protein